MPAKDGFFLTPRDIEFLRYIYLLRVATIDHLAVLTERSYTRTQKRTAKLESRGYIDQLTKPPRKILYALGREGLAALVEAGHAPEEILAKRIRTRELKDLFLRHLMMVKDIQVKLMILARGTSIRIPTWIEGESLYDSVTIEEKRHPRTVSVRIPVRPDAFFVLHDTSRAEGRNRLPFVLEADQSTESHERLRTKVKGYIQYVHHDRAIQKWGFKFFRVLIVTPTTARANNLRNDLNELILPQLRQHYIFTGIETLTLDSLIQQTVPSIAPS